MIPSAVASLVERGLADFLRSSFWSSTPGMERVIERLVAKPGALVRGPYISVNLPFRAGGEGEFFPDVPLGFPAHRHQEAAFTRLSGDSPRSTIVATGTGSGKTECFLLPILDACRQMAGKPGIKAILVYPMNALATDQAGRIARAISGNPRLNGLVRAGLYIGASREERKKAFRTMGPDHLITDRRAMQLEPPDILLTNYKMLDYLLVRPRDQELWRHNHGAPLRYLVVDELHSFDGAQGTDLACLVRRLKARLGVEPGRLCCVGTSATLGSGSSTDALRAYAGEVFGEEFDPGAVVTEDRLGPDEFFAGRLIEFGGVPAGADVAVLDPDRHSGPSEYVAAQQAVWFDEPIEAAPESDEWRVALGRQLLRHGMLRNLLTLLSGGPVALPELAEGIARTDRRLRASPELAEQVLVSFLSLVSTARSLRPERPEVRERREAAGGRPPTMPFLEVRLQLWQREMRRMVADLAEEPSVAFSDDLTEEQRRSHLPLVHCRECGAMGWAALVPRDRADLFRTQLQTFYRAWFADDPQVRFLWPGAAAAEMGWAEANRFLIDRQSLVRVREGDADPADLLAVAETSDMVTVKDRPRLVKDCPFCAARGSLTLVGFRAATLIGVAIDQLFGLSFNDDKKLLAFSDSVQDAAHRAGFFGARTWRYNLRVAIHRVVRSTEGKTLAELPAAFAAHWREAEGDEGFVSTFLAPSMDWLEDYEALRRDGRLPPGSDLVRLVERRAAFEILTEFGHQSRIGRSLPRTGCATTAIDSARLDAATDALLEKLRNEIGALRGLTRETLRRFLLGALHQLRERGGILHEELPPDFVNSAGKDVHQFARTPHLPSFSPAGRLPALLTADPRSTRFDMPFRGSGAGGWYERWGRACLGEAAPLLDSVADVFRLVLPELVSAGILGVVAREGGDVWGLSPDALRLTGRCRRLRCGKCRHWMVVAESEAEGWRGMPCLTARCSGDYAEDEGGTVTWFGRQYERGEVARVFAEEHTGLLTRTVREKIEAEFKAPKGERERWFPNLLSCTPTLEMGIDIGDLSSAILCSVPPSQANYLQRIGRAGRRDGNSFLLTLAEAAPHDLYFYATPAEMIAGEVRPPGVFLNASAVLERQLAAYCLDRWNAEGVSPDAVPAKLGKVFENLEDERGTRFPHNWLAFVRAREDEILDGFLALFPGVLGEETKQHLARFLAGDREDEGSLGWKILDAIAGERKQRESLRRQANRAKAALDRLKEAMARDKDHDQQVAETSRERDALIRLVRGIDETPVFEFLADQGFLPNYAFPESPIRLRSVIWRPKSKGAPEDGRRYETWAYEYARPAMSAISELAPSSLFYAGGRRVKVEQVDVEATDIEQWRFCDSCAYSACVDVEDEYRDCPQCRSPGWGEESQRRPLLRLTQVFSNTSDRDSRIRDDREDREPQYFNRDMLIGISDHERDGAFQIDAPEVPFAFEYYRRAVFREVNFGVFTDQGPEFSVAGRSGVRPGFVICKHCGWVQSVRPGRRPDQPPEKAKHAIWCTLRNKAADAEDFETAVYLYREFASEAMRMLLPLAEIGTERQLHSFVAAFELGLRDRYGGRVDHLHTTVYSEPEGAGELRRQYLVLYDTVPGGTGYLKDITRLPGEPSGPHPIFTILERALARMTRCGCFDHPDRDGCYRCIFAYRRSREMADTSAETAISLFQRILEHRDELRPVAALSEVSVSGLMDSVLEARFVEVFRRASAEGGPVRVEKAVVRGKPGYRIRAGDRTWSVEQQAELGPEHGVAARVSIDFMFHPPPGEEDGRPIAVFLDGFQYHRERIGRDLVQRMSLLASGRYDVWCFSWDDVHEALGGEVPVAPFLLHPDRVRLKDWLRRNDLGGVVGVLDRRPLDLFLERLSATRDPMPWARLAAISLISQMSPPGSLDLGVWKEAVRDRVPALLRLWFEGVDETFVLGQRLPTPESPVGVWVAAPVLAVRDPSRTDEYRLLVWLDDSPEKRERREFRSVWRGWLHLFRFLRAVPGAWFLTAGSREPADLAALVQARAGPGEVAPGSEAWRSLDVGAEFRPLLDRLAEAGVPLPVVGVDLPDARGGASDVQGELVWEDRRVAVVEDGAAAGARSVGEGWRIFELAALISDVGPLLDALGAGEEA